MVKQTQLIRSANKVMTYIENYVQLAGAERKEEVLELFDKIRWLFPQWVIGTCPMIHRDLQYVSPNCIEVFGYSREYLINNSRMDKYFNHIHEADKEDLLQCMSCIHDFLETISPEKHHLYRMIIHYRFLKPGGQIIYMHDEKACLYLPGSGNLYYGLFRDATAERPFTGVKVEIFEQGQTLNKIREYKPSAEYTALSKREGQLVMLIRQGLSTKEIAVYLNISPNTARNIKSRLFEKYRVSNSIELLNATAQAVTFFI